MKYKFKVKKNFFWKNYTVIVHSYFKEWDRRDRYFEDGGILSFGSWKNYDLRLGTDWVLATKKKMEEESGTNINLKVDA